MNQGYELIDSGFCQKLERFGPYTLIRPSPQAVWKPTNPEAWEQADASFARTEGERWRFRTRVPEEWTIEIDGIRFLLHPTEFGHLGIFAEQRPLWNRIRTACQSRPKPRVLNLFAYSGGSTLAAALGGAEVCHLDSAKGMVDWARKNAQANTLTEAPIRWIVDDATKFLKRELRRERSYDGIILDPPSFGRGADGEVFKIEEHILELLSLCNSLLSKDPLFVILSCHTAGFTEKTLRYLIEDCFSRKGQRVETGELLLPEKTRAIPNGIWADLRFL